jgi:DNA-binding NarL/FixJ family response regulator
MEPTPAPDSPRILVLKAELLYAEALAATAQAVFPHAAVSFSNRVQQAAQTLAVGPLDLLITGLGMSDGDMLDFLYLAMSGRRAIKRVLVATAQRDHHAFESLASLPLDGVFDTNGSQLGEFAGALRSVAAGRGYWSASLDLKPRKPVRDRTATADSYLTPVEQLVLSVIGDGSDDRQAAERLGIKDSSVHSVRRELHRKLGAQHRGELVRHAVQRGFVRFTDEGVQRPGYAMLLSNCPRRDAVAVTRQ